MSRCRMVVKETESDITERHLWGRLEKFVFRSTLCLAANMLGRRQQA